jgi:lambda repressor-like predicted transcriptional regulator
MSNSKNDTRLRWIQSMAKLHGTSIASIARQAKVDYSMVYRVACGQRTSARVERVLARELGLRIETLRRSG